VDTRFQAELENRTYLPSGVRIGPEESPALGTGPVLGFAAETSSRDSAVAGINRDKKAVRRVNQLTFRNQLGIIIYVLQIDSLFIGSWVLETGD
jgi:hypothetical protein